LLRDNYCHTKVKVKVFCSPSFPHTHTAQCTNTHAQMRASSHEFILTLTRMSTLTYIHAYTSTHVFTHIPTIIHTSLLTHMCSYILSHSQLSVFYGFIGNSIRFPFVIKDIQTIFVSSDIETNRLLKGKSLKRYF